MNRIFFTLLIVIAISNGDNALALNSFTPDQGAGSLIVGVVQEDNFPLVYFDSEANPKGFEVSIARHLAKTGGFELREIKKFPDQESLRSALRNQEIDFAFSKMKKNSADAEQFIYSKAHITLGYVFLFNRVVMAANDLQVNPLGKIAGSGLSVGTLDNPLYTEQLQRMYPGMTIRVFTSKQAIFDAAISGEIAACYLDEMEVQSFFLNSPAKALYLHYVKGQTNPDAVALVFPWNKFFFREWVNIFLTKNGYTTTQLSGIIRRYSPDLFDIQESKQK
jgi:ABC-type amino acid transport substrate-binding protein